MALSSAGSALVPPLLPLVAAAAPGLLRIQTSRAYAAAAVWGQSSAGTLALPTLSCLKSQAATLQDQYSELHARFQETLAAEVGGSPAAAQWERQWAHQVRAVSEHQAVLRRKGAARDTAEALRRAQQAHRELASLLTHI